jgi:class 3 adenylate cyclase/tetratricopeptide (TPR) repeat protein/ABC-type lipoprotein export system ATPase subunit
MVDKEVRNWLIDNGFERFADAFEFNEVDWALLLELSNDDLKDLGVAKLADRKKMLAVLAPLRQPEHSHQSVGESSSVSATAHRRTEAEHRQLSVMLCDLVGSTELATRLDAEAYRSTVRHFHQTCASAVQLHGGFVAQYLGDGVLVYFGYPVADEYDAERAVTAGLDVVRACRRAKAGSVRVGIATGRVIVGDLIGSGSSEQTAVTGETPNLAARLQSLASPDSVVVSNATRNLAGGGFEYTALGEQHVKGFAAPIAIWQVARSKPVESRFESSHGAAMNPLLGRKTELNLLLDRWQLACGSEGQAVFISGEAGIGKSRLLEGLRQEVDGSKLVSIRYQCVPNRTTSAFFPAIAQLQRAADLEPDDSADARLDKIETVLQALGTVNSDDLKIFAHLLSIPFEHRYGAQTLSPLQTKTRTLEILVSQLIALAQRGPVLFLIEDAHWIDPASEELLELAISRIQQSRVLLVVTHRTVWKPSLQGYNNVSSLQLNRLGKTYSAGLVRAVAGDFLTDAAVERIVSRTDGIPLFIEELTKSLVEGGLDIAAIDIPDTLRASLLARIDRLSARAKEIVQVGSVIGRDIPLDLLEAVFQKQKAHFNEAIHQLIQTELLYRSGTASKLQYSFKHALVQDSVYSSMLTDVRQAHHLNVANTLVGEFPQMVETAPELVAYHFTEAQSHALALTYWHQAGKRSASRSADAEAVAQLNKAIDVLNQIEPTPQLLATKRELHIDLSGPLIATSGYSSAEMERNTQLALQLSEELGDTSRIFPILYSRLVYHLHTGSVARACKLAEDFLDLAIRNGDRVTIVQGHRLVGFSLLISGAPLDADNHLQQAAAFATPQTGGLSPSVYGQDIESTAKVLAAWAKLHCGYPAQAVTLFDQALARARALDHVNTLGVVLFHGANMFVSMRLVDRVQDCLSALQLINQNHELAIWQVAESIVEAGLLSLQGEYDKVLPLAETALDRYSNVLGMQMHTPFILSVKAQSQLNLQATDAASSSIEQALTLSGSSGARIEDAELKRLNAQVCYVEQGFCTSTQAAFEEALDIARQMQMKWYELRTAKDYASVLARHSRRDQCLKMLSPLLDTFDEGETLPDLLEARQLLARLSVDGNS